jgi:hypothetical protein
MAFLMPCGAAVFVTNLAFSVPLHRLHLRGFCNAYIEYEDLKLMIMNLYANFSFL